MVDDGYTLAALRARNNLGDQIRRFRQAAGWTQRELSDRTGIEKTCLSGMEQGLVGVSVETIGKLAAAFQVQIIDLLTEPDQTTSR